MPIPDQTRDNATAPAVHRSPLAAPGATGGSVGVLRIASNYPYLLAHHRDNWDLETAGLDGPTWLPQLQEVPVMPGVGGARTVKEGADPKTAYDLLIRNMEGNGFVVLPGDIKVDGVEYSKGLDCVNPRNSKPGVYWVSSFAEPRYRRGNARQKFKLDRAAYNRWRLALVEQGHIAPPNPEVVDYAVGRARYHLDRHTAETRLDQQTREALISALGERLSQMEAAGSVPVVGDNAVARRLKSLTVARLAELTGPVIAKGKRKGELIAVLCQSITLDQLDAIEAAQ